MKLTALAYAKLNFTLRITGVRDDGYHLLEMLMQSVDLHDTVTVETNSSGRIGIHSDANLPCGRENIAYKAAESYFAAAGEFCGADILIEKRIPVCGGLAGGSADAAAVLAALNHIFGALDNDRLRQLALTLGSDVPFCLTGGTAVVRGIGDKIEPASDWPDCTILLAGAGKKPSTGEMYRRLDALPDLPKPDCAAVLRASEKGDLQAACSFMGNAFDVLWDDGATSQIRRTMLDCGSMNATLSGSGPTVFGIFDDEHSAQKAYREISAFADYVHLCRPCKSGVAIITE
jgi:4-diphosphocytidyl-2-C-methyl-D-erythritol kinase